LGIDIVSMPADIGDAAIDAFQRFGKGRHPAALNMGDCFAYACAKRLGVPLLYKGDDFSLTDIHSALETDP
jgi:ribonuclease VapC